MKLWQKETELDKEIEAFTVGNDYILDKKLVKYDCIASIAHAEMLGKMGVLTTGEVKDLSTELTTVIELWQKGEFEISPADEDCHTAIENHLTAVLGDTGKKIHTYRSRNDQVVTALRLYYKDETAEIKTVITDIIKRFAAFIKTFGSSPMPGFTHTRKAMPSSVEMWTGAFADAMKDNLGMLDAVIHMLDQSPLGTAAGYGLPVKVDRQFTAKKMGFSRVQQNPVYVQNSRGKFEAALLNVLSLIMLDLNRMASDLILFSMPEFPFFKLPDEFLTGSSIMPHKRNPDLLEILRAGYQKVSAYESQVKGIAVNLISGYHRDLQLTKEPMMAGLDVTKSGLKIVRLLFEKLEVNQSACEAAMTDELYSAQRAYELVKEGKPFRDAYQNAAKTLSIKTHSK